PRFVPRPPPAEDLAAYVSQGVAVSAYAARAVILLRAPLAEAAQRISPSAGVLEAVGADTCRLTTGAPDLTVLVIHVLMMGIDFEVIEPPELTDLMRDARERLTRALDGP
ncbi:DNA-binding transcriptional regulator, partial [Streptomyces sp. BF-3]